MPTLLAQFQTFCWQNSSKLNILLSKCILKSFQVILSCGCCLFPLGSNTSLFSGFWVTKPAFRCLKPAKLGYWVFALCLEGLNCTAQGWRVIFVPSLPAQWRGWLCPPWRCPLNVLYPEELCQSLQRCTYGLKCEGSGNFGSGSCLENLQVFGTWIQK